MEKRFKKENEISELATNLQTQLNTIITTIRSTNSNNNDQSLLPNIITTVRETLYPGDTKGQNDYKLFKEFLPHATGVEGFDNPFEVEFAAILSTTINEINKNEINKNSPISQLSPSDFVSAQSSYKTVKPTDENLKKLYRLYLTPFGFRCSRFLCLLAQTYCFHCAIFTNCFVLILQNSTFAIAHE